MDFDLEYKLQLFREEQPELFDAKGKRYTGTELSNRTSEMMFELINELERALEEIQNEATKTLPINSVSGSALEAAKQIPQVPQTQASLIYQLKILRIAANKLGLYDAADFIKRD
jgi:hypothetical protein